MKKTLFLILTFSTIFSGVSLAQTFTKKQKFEIWGAIPRNFTDFGSNEILIYSTPREDKFLPSIEIYNSNLELVKSIKIDWDKVKTIEPNESELVWLGYEDIQNDSYHSDDHFIVTQTFFNNDEKFEYVIGSTVFNEDGEVVLTLPERAKWEDINIIRLGDKSTTKYYLVYGNYPNDYTFYHFDKNVSSIKKVENFSAPRREIYGVDGRRLDKERSGVNILRDEDGRVKKYLRK